MNMNEELTPEEKAELADIKVPKKFYPRGHETEEVSPQEYKERLVEAMNRDAYLVTMEKEKRISHGLQEWKKKVGPRFGEATTDNPRILDRVQRLASGNGAHKTSLVLSGTLGVGKTYSAYAFINLAIASGAVTPGQIVADTETAILGKISSSGFKRSELLEELFNPRYKIYFIDDVGQGYFSNEQSRREVWYELMDHVYTHDLTLIITTNKPFQMVDGRISGSPQLEQWVGGAAYDRLKHIVGVDGLIVPGNVNKRPGVFERREEEFKK
jgi:DNA replication protein DnaC